jgi:small-conductance mechanosensitive channel
MKSIENVLQSWLNKVTVFYESGGYVIFGVKIIKALLILVAAKVIIRVGSTLIKKLFEKQVLRLSQDKENQRKNNTLKSLIQSILTYIVYFISGIMILSEFGIETTSIIATAGIGGLAIGFGAQNLVKDVITGFFILFEDQYGVGDFVTIGDTTGTVEEIGLRITKIRGFKGDLSIIPNGQISKVINFSRGNSLAIVDMSISYEMNINHATKIMEEVASQYAKDNPDIVEEPKVLGITNFGNPDITIRLIARTLPMKHWGVERELRKLMKEAFDNNGIEIPYPRRVIIQKNQT